jgi:uncharacterized SAM-dependent methyltransferase
MLNKAVQTSLHDAFAADTFEWFCGRAGHMERWQYLDPAFEGDVVRGSHLWTAWEAVSGKDNMLHRQGRIIGGQVNEMVALTKPRHTLIDLGPGSFAAISRNTMPFINAYGDDLGRYISVDVSQSIAEGARNFMAGKGMQSFSVNDDFFEEGLRLPYKGECVAVFMGGTIGNIEAAQNTDNAIGLMASRIQQLKHNLPAGTVIFIGLEATQDGDLLYADYDHAAHAEFEINMVHGIKRDLLANEDGFDPYGWKYAMKWWPNSYQFCHLAEVTKPQRFTMLGRDFEFAAGDQLVIDNSFKFPVLAMQRATQMAGSHYISPFADEDGRMVVHALKL